MAIVIVGGKFLRNGAGITMPEGTSLHIDGTEFSDNKTAIEVRDRPSLMQAIGLPADAPADLVREALQLMAAEPVEKRREKFSATRLFAWLGTGTVNLVSIAANLATITTHPQFPAILAWLSK